MDRYGLDDPRSRGRGAPMLIATLAAPIALSIGFAWGVLMMRREVFPFALVRRLIRGPGGPDPERKAIRDFFSAYPRRAEIVFIGDSLFSNIHWQDVFPGQSVVTRAIGGETTAQILGWFQSAVATQAPIAVLLAGTNDTIQGIPTNEAFANIAAMQRDYPGRLFVLTLPPCAGSDQQRLARVRALNAKLRELPDIIDIFPLILPSHLADSTHFNHAGNEVMISAIEETLSAERPIRQCQI